MPYKSQWEKKGNALWILVCPGARIRFFRDALGLTTQQLADLTNVRRQAVEQWEVKGVQTLKLINKIAQALGIRPEALLTLKSKDGSRYHQFPPFTLSFNKQPIIEKLIEK